MNEFTKEELMYLEEVLHKRILEECRPRFELDIRIKIKSMLKNFYNKLETPASND